MSCASRTATLPAGAPAPRRRAAVRLCLFALPVLAAFAAVAAACGGDDATGPASSATAFPTKLPPGETAFAGSGPPSREYRQLTDDRTGATEWLEVTVAGVTFRGPTDAEWELAVDEGVGGTGFAGLPNIRVTHLTTGQARVYSLVDGAVLLCSDRSAVLAMPTTNAMKMQGEPVDCARQPLTAQERVVFEHVRVTGSYDRYRGPLDGEPTFPGLVLPTARPEPSKGPPMSPTPHATQPNVRETPAPVTPTPG